MLQNLLVGFDILGIGVIVASVALLWGFWKVLHDNLEFEDASRPTPDPETRDRGAGAAAS